MKFNSLYIICIVLLAFFSQSCTKMNDLHAPYLKAGEIIYAAKVDSVAPGAGKLRIQLEMFIIAQRIETMRIYWNDYKDSLDVPVNQKTGSWKTMLNSMTEKGYIFQYVSIDKYGHRSLPFEVTGNVYGDRYQSRLSNRVISSKSTLENGKITIKWSGAVDNGVRCDLVYTNTSGAVVTQKVPMNQTSTVLTDMASDLKYQTLFLPEKMAIDTFYTEFVPVNVVKITGIQLQNPGNPFLGTDVSGRWGNLPGWTVNDACKNHNGIGGFDNINNGGFISFEYWGTPAIVNGKIYQTLTLPAGSYSFIATVSTVDGKPEATYVTVAEGVTLPDISAIGTALASSRLTDKSLNGKDVSVSFQLTKETIVSVGFASTMLNINQTSVRIQKVKLVRFE